MESAIIIPVGSLISFTQLVGVVSIIGGLILLSKVKHSAKGNLLSFFGMLLCVGATILEVGESGASINFPILGVGLAVGLVVGGALARFIDMKAMPELVALFNGFGGAASMLIAGVAAYTGPAASFNLESLSLCLGVLIGSVSFLGSLIAIVKLKNHEVPAPLHKPVLTLLGAVCLLASGFFLSGFVEPHISILLMGGAGLLLGYYLVAGIGGADMPVVISLMNSYSGIAACATGFALGNAVLIIVGALVGSSGIILTRIMCDAMNRSLLSVMFGGEMGAGGESEDARSYTNVKSCGPEETAMILESCSSVIFVPGYGMAVAQAQHSVKELAKKLEANGAKVSYAIHPVAGRMPGHMNVLLAEAQVSYDKLLDLDEINSEFQNTDAVIVVGANDIVNPVAKDTPGCPIYGMPILDAINAKTVFVIKRSLSPGYAKIKNPLFEAENALMVFGDAKKVLTEITKEIP
jgi:H+-translocating NAD(P) transhydrogenase subunit beta